MTSQRISWGDRVQRIKQETYALYRAARHPRTPWYAKASALAIVAYAVSPIDLIPDFIPVLGYLDDMVLLPLAILVAIRMIPDDVMQECRSEAQRAFTGGSPPLRGAVAVVLAIWLMAGALTAIVIWRLWLHLR